MKQFKEFGIKTTERAFIGDKIKIDKILNKEITVLGFKVEKSNYDKGCGKCLHLQIEFAGEKRMVFIGSASLIDMISQVPENDFPFVSIVSKETGRLEFT